MKIRNFLPLLHVYVDFPFVTIRTALMVEHFDKAEREYIALVVKIWKWNFEFSLYDTYRRIHRREIENEEI